MTNHQRQKTNGSLNFTIHLLVVYLLLALILTWPTVSQFATHLPGDGGDDPAIAWNLWWVKYAILNRQQTPFLTDFMFYPVGINLAFYTLTVLNALTALPLTLNFGVVAAGNIHLFFTFVAGGYGAFLLVRYVLTTNLVSASSSSSIQKLQTLIWLSAAIAGGFYAFASNKLFYVALGQFNIASSHWVPFAVLYIYRTYRQPHRLKNPSMAALFLTLQAWAEMTYASFILVFIGLFGLYRLFEISIGFARRRTLKLHLRNLVIFGAAFAMGISPILAYMVPDMLTEGDFLVEGSGFAGPFSADLFGFLLPTVHHPLLGDLITQTNIRHYTLGQHIYLGFVLVGLLLLALATGYRRPELRFWLIAVAVFALLCLGPTVTINGHLTNLPGPFIIFQELPFFKGNRYPSRYSVMLLLSLSVVAGFSLVWLGRRIRAGRRRYAPLFALIAGVFLFEHASLPLPQTDMRVPAYYRMIAEDPGNYTVLDIPFAWRNGFSVTGPLTTQFMLGQFYQTAHQKRLLQGNTSRNPEFKFQYFIRAPVINSLLALETGRQLPPEQWDLDKAIAPEVLRFFDIQYLIVRPYSHERFDGKQSQTVTQEAVIPYIEAVLPVDLIYRQDEVRVYRVIAPTDFKATGRIETGAPLASLYFGEGWGLLTPNQPITAQRGKVKLLLPFTADAQRISLRLRLPDEFPESTNEVYLSLDGRQTPPQAVDHTWQTYTFELPEDVIQPGLNEVYLHFAEIHRLSSEFAGRDDLIDVTVLSAGEEVGGFSHIFINGYDASPNERGYNIAITNEAVDRSINAIGQSFDTHLDPAASVRLAQYLEPPPEGWSPHTIVAVGAADEAGQSLGEEAVEALHAIGATGDLRDCFRCSHAIISDVGQPDGRVLEALSPLHPVGVTTSLGLTEPAMAATLDWIEVE